MAKQSYTVGQVLTSAQMSALQLNDYNQTVSTKTASYTLVAADAGTRIVMNSASATTITVDTSLFTAGDTLSIHNIGAGNCTVTAGTCTVAFSGSLVVPTSAGGTLYFTSASSAIFFATGNIDSTVPTSNRNKIINGGFDVWQRGTSSGSAGYQTADRWFENATASTTFAQETTIVPNGSRYSFKMTAGATAQMIIQQAIETMNSLSLADKTVTASALVSASVSTGMSVNLFYSTSVDVSAGGSWTQITATSGGTATAVSGSFVKLSGVYAVPSTAKSVMMQVQTTSTVATSVIVYVAQAQLEVGSVATPFEFEDVGTTLAKCQRYLPAFNTNTTLMGYAYGTNTSIASAPFHTQARVPPTGITITALNTFTAYNSINTSSNPSSLTLNIGGISGASLLFGHTATIGTPTRLEISGGLILFTGCEL